jgi:hypothetical protein
VTRFINVAAAEVIRSGVEDLELAARRTLPGRHDAFR